MDLLLFHAVNAWCGKPALDAIALFADRIDVLKGGLTIAALWWFWFEAAPSQQNRRIILTTLIGLCLAVLISRTLAAMLPFRMRPMYTLGIGYHPPAIQLDMDLENWSSFPSDHAAMWFAIVCGIWRLSRPVGIAAAVFVTVWICLVRVYLGVHYPSDLAVGALIGVVSTSLVLRSRTVANLSDIALRFESRSPPWFYALAFLLSFEMAIAFDDVRRVLRGVRLALAKTTHHQMDLSVVLMILLAITILTAATVYLGLRCYQRAQPRLRSHNR